MNAQRIRVEHYFLSSYYSANAKTVWAAFRALIFGCVIIVVGLAMTILGYFDKHLSTRIEVVEGNEIVTYDKFIRYQLKSMQYLGPILMGIGSFILIIACVVTLESRDKHAQIITEDTITNKNKSHVSHVVAENIDDSTNLIDKKTGNGVEEAPNALRLTALDANQLAPLADVDSITDISITGGRLEESN